MSDEEETNTSLAEDFWSTLGTGGPLPVKEIAKLAMERPISLEDIRHVNSLYPYIDICNSDVRTPPPDSTSAALITTHNKWLIYDRGDRLTAGPGRLSFGSYRLFTGFKDVDNDENEDEESGGGEWVIAEGTLLKQCFAAAVELIAIAKQRWPSAEVLGGLPIVLRAAWIAAQDNGFALNYNPTERDQKVCELIKANGGIRAFGSKGTPTPGG